MTDQAQPGAVVDFETSVRRCARRLTVDEEDAILVALDRSGRVLSQGRPPTEALSTACALLRSWSRHPSNHRRARTPVAQRAN